MKTIAPFLIEEPEEFDPIELLNLAKKSFRLKSQDFALIFGIELQVISTWRRGFRQPSRQARIRAATLKKMWGLNEA